MTSNSNTWRPSQMKVDQSRTAFWIHVVMAGVWGAVMALTIAFSVTAHARPEAIVEYSASYFVGAVALLHALLALGAWHRVKVARVLSMIVGVLMMLGFPIGTIIGFFLLQSARSQWNPPARRAD